MLSRMSLKPDTYCIPDINISCYLVPGHLIRLQKCVCALCIHKTTTKCHWMLSGLHNFCIEYLYHYVHCTTVSTVPLCPLYHCVHCTTVSTVPLCPLYHCVHCTTMSTVPLCLLLESEGSLYKASFACEKP